MRLPRDPFDRQAQDTAIAAALTDTAQSAIYLDTSSLVWTYRLAEGARKEFIDWIGTGPRLGKVHVPSWALHELYRHRRSPDTLLPARPKVRAIEADLSFIQEAAALFADDVRAKAFAFDDRASYLNFLRKAASDLTRAMKMLKDSVELTKVEEQLLPFLEGACLTAQMPTFSDLQREFAARSEGRIPPGYRDAGKRGDAGSVGGDGANRYGDFVFWKEILVHTGSKPDIEKVVIITHDQKDDWVYFPERYVDYDGKTLANNAKPKVVTCPHPTLSHEISTVSAVNELYIVTIPQLIQLLSSHGASREVQQLARAVQIEQAAEVDRAKPPKDESGTEEAVDGQSDVAVETSVLGEHAEPEAQVEAEPPAREPANPVRNPEDQVEGEPPVQEPAIPVQNDVELRSEVEDLLDALAPDAKADARYPAMGADDSPDYIIRALKTYNWYRQNPAMSGVAAAVSSGAATPEQIFVLGRNVYQAACGNSHAAVQLIENLGEFLARRLSPNADIFFAGIVYEAYFDSEGNIRPTPKNSYLEPIFVVALSQRFADVKRWFRRQIAGNEMKYVRLPGDPPNVDTFNLSFADGKVTSIHLRGFPITRAVDEDSTWDSLPSKVSELELRQLIAEHFATVERLVAVEPHLDGNHDLSHLVLIEWGTNTEVVFPERH
ncbi:PIN-like domain-containing protein [Rubellimicrobium aerolatum]|uniref:PIN-like domain-containing protein n=1 Tax=Rubellimicrobium aerolatum TaxID=490979 RepID=A0ABW0SEI8_9RHOB|nr:PIN-like domain-containing protein [Rubellimicrobium aerolatum]MBP1806878.1 hypothetical protein [Rubellimicrobium aerolatum]